MPRVFFTAHLRKHQPSEPVDVAAATVRAALEAVFERRPELRGYILDDQGCVRQHVMIFVDDRPILDRKGQGDSLSETSEIHVMQALSGG